MKKDILILQSPEEEELERKKAELSALESQLVENELELATLESALGAFELRYLKIVGLRFAELHQIEAEIAELVAEQNPQNDQANHYAREARARAEETSRATDSVKTVEPKEFVPSESLKKLYYEAAKRFHPDLATDEDERKRKNKIMADINVAYAAGDEERLRAILTETEFSPENIKGGNVAAELVRIIRKISQVRNRLSNILSTIARLEASDLFKLMTKVKEAEKHGSDLLAEMAQQVNSDIMNSRDRLSRLKKAKGHLGIP